LVVGRTSQGGGGIDESHLATSLEGSRAIVKKISRAIETGHNIGE